MKETKCNECGKTVKYSTNKPKRCQACKEERQSKFQFRPKKPQRSKKEGIMQQELDKLMPDAEYIDNGYYSWMRSPKDAPLQLDRYYPELKIAFEFNGRQHYEYNPYMHKNREAFEYLQRCDRKKRRECRRQGIHLITIKYTKTITKDYLIRRFQEEGLLERIKSETTFLG